MTCRYTPLASLLLPALLLVANPAPAAPIVSAGGGDGVKDDLFDVSLLAVVVNNTPLLGCCGGAPAENALGGSGGVEGTNTLFADGAPVGSVDFIDFQTGTPIELTSYVATIADDSDNPANPGDPNRGSSSFTLYSSPDSTFSSLTAISTTALPASYMPNYGSNVILITDTFAPVTAEFFRIEVTRTTLGGPRIREVDGFGIAVPEPTGANLIAAATAGLVFRRRRSGLGFQPAS